MSNLLTQISTLRQAMAGAEKTVPPEYEFDDDGRRRDPRVVPIPVSLDQRKATLVEMLNHRVEMEAEIARCEIELENIKAQILTHQIEFSRKMLLMNIPAPMAGEDPPELPPTTKDNHD